MRFHLPALKGQPVTKENSSCAYTQKIVKFAQMMRARGHEVYCYGQEADFDNVFTEYVACYPDGEWTGSWDPKEWQQANLSAAAAISARAQEGDFLGIIAGRTQEVLASALPDLMAVEYGIGYSGTFAPYRVFESYAWMHMVYGAQAADPMNEQGRFYDAVIPNYFDVADFPMRKRKRNYLLFVGRLIERKGLGIAEEIARRLEMPLMIAGGEQEHEVKYGEVLGVVGPEARGKLMAEARALLCPTTYVEPFGGVAVEAQLCGTPVITTDWGAFTETVRHGVGGYRCRTMGEFLWAARHAKDLDPAAIRAQAVADYSLEAIAPRYEVYFEQVAGLRTGRDWDSQWEGLSACHRYGREHPAQGTSLSPRKPRSKAPTRRKS